MDKGYDVYEGGKLIAQNTSAEIAADLMQLDVADLEWAVEECNICQTDTHCAVEYGVNPINFGGF